MSYAAKSCWTAGKLSPGDAARITDAKDLEAVARDGAELLFWEMA
jgi:hypothetical protein